jgi:hypothetical protein
MVLAALLDISRRSRSWRGAMIRIPPEAGTGERVSMVRDPAHPLSGGVVSILCAMRQDQTGVWDSEATILRQGLGSPQSAGWCVGNLPTALR